jgi:hypothetical protein
VGGEASVIRDDGFTKWLEGRVEGDLTAFGEAEDADAARIDAGIRGEELERRERVGHVDRSRVPWLKRRGPPRNIRLPARRQF